MLPSCGHFKNIPCPFYKLALCVRPHCPYKHQNAENSHQRQLFSPLADETDILFSKGNLAAVGNSSTYDTVTESKEKATYIPTPVEPITKPVGILKSSSNTERASAAFVPEYKPTPISRLKEATTVPVKASKSVYTPEFPSLPLKKKKNVEEYDPTEVKVIPKKTVTFVDQTDEATDVPVVLISSEDEDLEDNEGAPQFSDDDFEEETTPISNATNQVPEVITIKEEEIEEEEIDPHSVVDKILVDCKKNELLLNSFKRVPPKTKELSSNVSKQEKNSTTEKPDPKIEKVLSIKKEKNVSSSKTDDINLKSKIKKTETSDFVKDVPPAKNSDSSKKDIKSEKNENSSEKVKKNSVSTHSKEKHKKDSKGSDKSKHSKKVSHDTKKLSSNDTKTVKSDKNSACEPTHKKDSKKTGEDRKIKHADASHSPDKKKSNNDSSSKSPKSLKSKEKHFSGNSAVKRKSDVLDSDSNQTSSKSEDVWEIKCISSSKKVKSSDAAVSDDTKPINEETQSDSDVDETMLNDLLSSSESDVDPEEECRRIFEECFPEESSSAKEDKKREVQEVKESKNANGSEHAISKKKRLAHPAASEMKPPSKQPKVEMKRTLNPAQVMFNRFAQCKAKFAQSNENKDVGKGGADKKKISFTNQGLLDAIKNKNQGNPSLGNFNPLPPTVSKTFKSTQRTAHVPESAMKARPIIPADYGSKVPANVRQKFLNGFIDECLKFCETEDEAYDLALEEEKKVYDRSSSRPLYLNVAANALKRLRNRAEEGPEASGNNASSKNSASKQKTVSHAEMLNGPLAQRRSFSVGRKKETVEIKGDAELYEYLMTYVMTPEQLKENSYPLPHPTEKGKAVIEGAYASRTKYCNDNFKRVCTRCCKTYYVNVDGDYVRDEECDFHWGRIWKKRIAGNWESRYSCCQGDAESDGCCVSPGHVFDGSEAHVLKGYVKTLPKTPPQDKCYGIYALDCEMCYTTAGLELTRITVVDASLKPVYETFVKPLHKVQDYNTRFSGITEDDLKNVRTTLQDVQAVLLLLFNDRTILIGHSLESDFKALKLFHKTVVDTSVVFPHKSGLPFKRALKTLMAEKLNKIIQNDVGGHDSKEDAVACMELMLWKVKEDARGNR